MRGAALALCLASPALADPPSELEVLDTLVREAADLRTTGSIWTEAPVHGATRFVTLMLYELGMYLPQSEDSGSISVRCEEQGEDWQCRVAFGVRWDDAESAYVASMVLQRVDEPCESVTLDLHGTYGAGCWTVKDGVIQMELFG